MVYVGVGAGTGRRDCAATSPTRELSVFSKGTIAGGLITGQACDLKLITLQVLLVLNYSIFVHIFRFVNIQYMQM